MAGTSDPLYVDDVFPEVSALLSSARYRLLDAVEGMLLFERNEVPPAGSGPGPGIQALSERFYDFTRPAPGEVSAATPAHADFEGYFELRGYRVTPVPEVNFGIRRSVITLYVRALRPSERALRVTTFRLGADDLARIHDDGNPTQLWRPTYTWRAGEELKLTYPPITALAGERLGIGAQAGIESAALRLRVTSRDHRVVDGGRVVIVGSLP